MKQRKPTSSQLVMIVLMLVAWTSMFAWLVPELRGIFSPEAEDTYSEWVWDLELWQTLAIAFFHVLAGVRFIWSGGHFIEGWIARR